MATNIIAGNTYTFKNLYSGKMLNLYGGYTTNGTNVRQYTADGSDEQKWVLDGSNTLYTYGHPDKCLDRYNSPGSLRHNNADIWDNTDDANQKLVINTIGSYVTIKIAGTALFLTAYHGTSNGGNTDARCAPGATGNVFWATSSDENVVEAAQQKWIMTLVEQGSTSSSGDGYRINGVDLPLSEWPVGSYWTDDGTPYGNSLNHNGTECAGFARYVYNRIWGSDTYGNAISTKQLDEESNGFFDDINVGARINCDRRDGGGNHSMVLLDKTSSGVTVYEANHTNDPNKYCIIGMRTITYDSFKNEYINIKSTSYTP